MQLRRARFLSSEVTMYQGAEGTSVADNVVVTCTGIIVPPAMRLENPWDSASSVWTGP
jgi:hypothetical protein